MAAINPLGVLSPSRQSLTIAQRQQYNLLRAQGIDDATARALAQAMVQKSANRERPNLTDELRLVKSAWDESQHPRDKEGKFGEGGGPDAKALKHKGKEFERQSGQEHLKAAKVAHEKASKAQSEGKADKAAQHLAVAKAHTDEVERAVADHKKQPVEHKEYEEGTMALLHAYSSGGREEQNKVLASMRPALRESLMSGDRHIAKLERREKSSWDESSHPRAKDGTFGSGGMSSKDHARTAFKANIAAIEAHGRGDHATAKMLRAVAEKHSQLAKEVKKSRTEEVGLAWAALEAVAKKRSQPFEAKFVDHAKEKLPDHWYDMVHAGARAATGGQISSQVRRENKSLEAKRTALDKRAEQLREQQAAWDKDSAALEAEEQAELAEVVLKSVMAADSIHVEVPLGGRVAERGKRAKLKRIKKFVAFDEDVQLAADALAMGDVNRLKGANRLAAGMDWEIRYAKAATPQEARARASRQLAQDESYYDNRMQRNDGLRLIKGLDVDLGSGQVREPGYLGLDLYPYDYGTAIFDVAGAQLPFPDASVRSVRLVHALQYMPDLAQDATPLLVDIQRCLNYGGQLLYVGLGDLTQKVDLRQIPGLVLVQHEDNSPLNPEDSPDNSQLTRQVFERVRVRVPRFYGADPEWLGIGEEGADDIALALAAYGAGEEADQAMSRLFKSASDGTNADMTMGGGAPIPDPKAYKKIIHAVVYAPNELDYDGEFMEAEQIEEAAHRAYMDRIPVRSEHGPKIGAQLVESYIAPVPMTLKGQNGPQAVPQGAWVVAIQFTDDEEWAKVLNGQYRGISVGGRALLEQR